MKRKKERIMGDRDCQWESEVMERRGSIKRAGHQQQGIRRMGAREMRDD